MKFFQLFSNKKSILILFLIFIGFNAYFFLQFQELNEIVKQEVKILDLRFGYTSADVNLFFEQIGNEGRELYAKISFADMFYPVSYGLLIISLLSFLAKGNSSLYLLNLFPILGIAIDFVENTNIMKLMSSFPNLDSALVSFTSTLTQLKWIFIIVSVGSVLLLFSRKIYLNKKSKS